jgi:hypothetical protein
MAIPYAIDSRLSALVYKTTQKNIPLNDYAISFIDF